MVEELSGQYTAARRSHSGFSIQLQILYCLGKQLTSRQAEGCFAYLLAYQQVLGGGGGNITVLVEYGRKRAENSRLRLCN